MNFDLYSIDYLKNGSARQKRAFESLAELNILSRIAAWSGDEIGTGEAPALAGSLPLDLATDESDLDIITFAADLKSYAGLLKTEFGMHEGYQSSRGIVLGVATLITKFRFHGEAYEVFTQNVPVPLQNAVVHLLIEERLLHLGGPAFREQIWQARLEGLKTEPAFGRVLGLEEPYRELISLEELSDDELCVRFADIWAP